MSNWKNWKNTLIHLLLHLILKLVIVNYILAERPIKAIEYGATKSWVVLECSSKEAKRALVT